jgi:predicted phage tail protein
MRKVYLEGRLGKEFGEEWTLAVNTPAEALQAIAVQRPGLRKFLMESEGIEGYDILVDDEPIDDFSQIALSDPAMHQSYSFVPVTVGSKSKMLTMVVGVALVAATGGMAGVGIPGFMGSTQAAIGAGVTQGSLAAAQAAGATAATVAASTGVSSSIAAASITAAQAGVTGAGMLGLQAASYLGMGLVLAGAAAMLTPEVDDGGGAEQAENYHFSGPINTVKQGGAVPLVYGRAIVGSTTISASLYSQTSRTKISKGRKLVGISNFRTDGSRFGGNASSVQGPGFGGIGGGGFSGINIGAAHR